MKYLIVLFLLFAFSFGLQENVVRVVIKDNVIVEELKTGYNVYSIKNIISIHHYRKGYYKVQFGRSRIKPRWASIRLTKEQALKVIERM